MIRPYSQITKVTISTIMVALFSVPSWASEKTKITKHPTVHETKPHESHSSHHESDSPIARTYNVAALVGLDITGSGPASLTGLGYGIRVGYALNPTWSAGLSFQAAGVPISAPGTSAGLTLILADVDYHLDGDLRALWGGLRGGVGMSSFNYPTPPSPVSSTNLALGAMVGYDFSVPFFSALKDFTIGPVVSYMVTFTSFAITDLQAQLAVRFWF